MSAPPDSQDDPVSPHVAMPDQAMANEGPTQLAVIFDAMADAVFVFDAQARFTHTNQAARTMMADHYPPDFVALSPAERLRLLNPRDAAGQPLPPEQWPGMRILRGEELAPDPANDVIIHTARGEDRVFNISGRPLYDAAGQITGAITVNRDVTERRRIIAERDALLTQAEAASARQGVLQAVSDTALSSLDVDTLLNSLLDRVRAVMNLDNTAILLVDATGTLLTVRAARGLEEEVAAIVRVPVGQGFAGTIAATRQPLIVDNLKTFPVVSPFLRDKLHSALGVPLLVEERLLGVLHVGTAMPHAFNADDVRLLQIVANRVALALDHAQLFQAERRASANAAERSQLLQASETRYRATFEQAAVGIGRVALDGHWLEVNQRLCDIVGYTRAAMMDLTFQDITYPADLTVDLDLVAQLLAGTIATYTMEKRYYRKDGSLIWINLTVALVRDQTGAPGYFISVVEDINARKQAEAQVRELTAELEGRVIERTRQLAEANQDLEAFSYSVAHDLRAPLRAMQGFAQALAEDYGEKLDDTARLYTGRIVRAAQRMDDLIQDLLEYSRLGRADIRPETVNLAEVARTAQHNLQAQMQDTGARISVTGELPRVRGHFATLTQVFTNLLGNATKFVPPGRLPDIRLWAEPHMVAGKPWTRVWVADNGIGIALDHQERIFRAFERLHGVEEYPGTGIGLAIVRKGMERMGGRAGVASIPGEGSQFWIELPLAGEK